LHAGRKLKVLRNDRSLTSRQVEDASRRIAAAMGDKRFCISNGWLTQLENGDSEPSICKIFSLCAIYKVRAADLIRLYDVDIEQTEKYEPIANPHTTQLLAAETEDSQSISLCDRPTTVLPGNVRSLKSPLAQLNPGAETICYGYIGLNDMTMYPMIRPGSLVRIDTSHNKVQSSTNHNQFERPIYFVELRESYACGWCELQGNDLLIIPHHTSPARIRRLTYIKDAEIVGRVIGFDTRCVDEDEADSKISDTRKRVRIKSVG
jgi:transcriptional regulator with XRE-family HTH domain